MSITRFDRTILAASIAFCMNLGITAAAEAQPSDVDLNGNFLNDNDVLQYNFSIDQPSRWRIFTSSWDDGGFDPIVALWDSDGNLVYEQDDGHLIDSAISNGVSYDFGMWDSNSTEIGSSYEPIPPILNAGTYTVTLAQYDNFAAGLNLSAGFKYDGINYLNFTESFGCSNGQFCGVYHFNNDNRIADYELHIQVEPVPEPITGLVLAAGLGGAALKRAKDKSKKS